MITLTRHQKPASPHLLNPDTLTPARRILEAAYGNLQPAPEPISEVWTCRIDGSQITVIDPQQDSPEEIRHFIRLKFGQARVGRIRRRSRHASTSD